MSGEKMASWKCVELLSWLRLAAKKRVSSWQICHLEMKDTTTKQHDFDFCSLLRHHWKDRNIF